jgi:hypothetical protein
MNVQQLIESSNQYKVIADDAKKLSSKWVKSGLLEGLKGETDRNTMAMLLENQAKQLVTEASQTGTVSSPGGYGSEAWNGVALPLVRRVFGEIAAKEFVSVQPMNLPSGLVFYLDFKYGTGVNPFSANGSMYGANASSNVTDITSASLYGAGKFGYSINQFTASAAATTASANWADLNFEQAYSASAAGNQWKKINVALPTGADPNGVRAFIITSGSSILVANNLQQFTTVNAAQTSASFIISASLITVGPSTNVTLFYNEAPTSNARGDFEDALNAGYPTGQLGTSASIAIPEVNVALKSEAIVAKTRKLKAQWTPEFAQDLNAYHSVDAEAELTGIL